MKKNKVLIDLNVAANNGYCGIAKENRLIFKVLSHLESIEANGLLISSHSNKIFSSYKKQTSRARSIEQSNYFFHELSKQKATVKSRLLAYLSLTKHLTAQKNKFSLYPIDPIFQDVIWRNVFDKSLNSFDKDFILQNDFYFSDFTATYLKAQSYFNKPIYLDTSAYDFAVFLEPTPISVSPNTIKIVRYHDAIPITDPDFGSRFSSRRNFNLLKLCTKNSYFVCNSEPTRNTLLSIYPELESKTFVIPCLMLNDYKKLTNEEIVKKIMVSKLSKHLTTSDHLSMIRKKIHDLPHLDYIFNLATLEPRKNHINLIRAWEKLQYQQANPLKLVIAANPGWLSKEIEALMQPHVEMGNIIHLNNLSIEEIAYLFSHAKAFVFPSYTEGFGLPPLEAMQCECPTIVSDIPTHRWVMGDASLYCNPYDVNSLADAINKLTDQPNANEIRQDLIQKGLIQVKQYTEDAVKEKWAELFDKIRPT